MALNFFFLFFLIQGKTSEGKFNHLSPLAGRVRAGGGVGGLGRGSVGKYSVNEHLLLFALTRRILHSLSSMLLF